MQRFSINDENELIKEGKRFNFSTKSYIGSIQNYINKYLVTFLNIQIDNGLELVVNDGTYLVYKDEIIYKPIRQLLNVDYKEMDKDKKFEYYYTMFQSKLTELSIIKTEEDLLIKFPELYSIYTKRKQQIREAIEVYSRSNRVFPSKEADSIRSKYLQQYKIDKQLYGVLLNESSYFNVSYFVSLIERDMANLINNLSMFIDSISSFAIDVYASPYFDYNKISSVLNGEHKLKR